LTASTTLRVRTSGAHEGPGPRLTHPPKLVSAFAVAGPEEARGPFGQRFDEVAPDYEWGESSFERSERKLLLHAVSGALARGGLDRADVDIHLGGDLLDQITTHSFVADQCAIPFVGVFNACATLAGALGLAATTLSAGAARRALASVSSHYYTAERQYRYPTELGVQRATTNQRTATGAAAFVLEGAGSSSGRSNEEQDAGVGDQGATIRVTRFTPGRVRQLGVKDPNNMGAAEAPAAADTLLRHFAHGDVVPEDYDLILSGDLARVGLPLARELCAEAGLELGDRWQDAGCLLYAPDQPADAGGSGAACCALVLAAHVLPRLRDGRLGRVLLVATGSLHSKTTYLQGDVIPAIAHAVELEGPAREGETR
jgi:stage V sporulation protein AD